IDDEADTVRERAIEIPQNSADAHHGLKEDAPRVTQRESEDSGRIANESRARGTKRSEQRVCEAGPFRESDAPAGESAAGPAALAKSAASPPHAGGRRLDDGQRGLLGELAIARLLSLAEQRLELVVERVGILQARVHDLEAYVAHRIGFRETFEDHLTDPLRSDLRRSALTDRRLDVVDQPVDRAGSELFRRRLPDRARELATIELLTCPVALHD